MKLVQSGAPVRRGTKIRTSCTSNRPDLHPHPLYIYIYIMGHASCPKCGAATDGAGKSCGSCGATCPV
ncbi:hypothetical protein N7499_011818 [Penicillium canescens]|nr:uncharacterized protein N7446_007080 [Penicillium canescens]KAJ6012511.1 hypothetical protein N7522_002866 [Penicillium canescens]KAJ6049594.1 hypothetical protein N7444_006310 [Penicillium canescens]KAJ6052437.1 hypothetical protein N7460_002971 [Penicillium canescens]KAJ6062960.1 hypothetical protein N7446_007080 [Penicillium canescens]KAJ6069931.1 hypothetical protein N7499_011818 [Penicillium canescens]